MVAHITRPVVVSFQSPYVAIGTVAIGPVITDSIPATTIAQSSTLESPGRYRDDEQSDAPDESDSRRGNRFMTYPSFLIGLSLLGNDSQVIGDVPHTLENGFETPRGPRFAVSRPVLQLP